MRALLEQGVRAIGPYRRVVLDDQVALDFAWVPPGVFLMGSPDGDPERYAKEGPVHQVCLGGFPLGRFEVTRAQYAAFDPAYRVEPGKENFPAGGVSFESFTKSERSASA